MVLDIPLLFFLTTEFNIVSMVLGEFG